MSRFRVFLSSVRRGLEEERDALPGLITALGHEPRRFEDYSAKPVPSRQACLDGVNDCDVYVLLLGAHYGDPLPDTGVSPTEEELIAARAKGIPILVFRKRGVPLDERQRDFVSRLEAYPTGYLRGSFGSAAELLTQVAAALRDEAERPVGLVTAPLTTPVEIEWLIRERDLNRYGPALLELHLSAPTASPLPVSALGKLADTLAHRGRDSGLFGQRQALDIGSDASHAWARLESSEREPAGIRASRQRAVSMWQSLPRDMLGVIIDGGDLSSRLTSLVRTAARVVGLPPDHQAAFAAALSGVGMASQGSVADLGKRSSASLGMGLGSVDSELVRVEPTTTVVLGAVEQGAPELARELAAELVARFRTSRR